MPRAGRTACYRAARVALRAVGVDIPRGLDRPAAGRPPERWIPVARAEDRDGRVVPRATGVAHARRYIDAELEAGRPVVVGVSYRKANYNADGITDHFVIIVGRGTDSDGPYYRYHQPGRKDPRQGAAPRNKLRIDPSTRNLIRPSRSVRYDLSMVVKNRRLRQHHTPTAIERSSQ